MKLQYDSDADAAYIYIKSSISDGEVKQSKRVTDDIVLDFDEHGKLLGMEVLRASKLIPKKELADAKLLVH